ncbi:uncharacterized protein QYS62_010090 [Fusarium acuminatum]|uniref:Myb-like domain-containing protein n=1 Tax=Fusarium acuminatum TaxID=5515 RepID=A0ABZ2X843_9HYPO
MATIEPRLIHLLNEQRKPQLNHTDLPPLHSLPFPTATDRSLPPLEPDTNHRGDRPAADMQFATNAVGSVHPISDDGTLDYRKEFNSQDRTIASASRPFSLRGTLGDMEIPESINSISRILDDGSDVFDDVSTKKRHRGLHVKDDFVQLPQPLKKQRAIQAAPVMPPIINGLHEPPPHAALFPPISSDSQAAKQDGKADVHLEKILVDGSSASAKEISSASQEEVEKSPKQKKSRAHRKKMEDLVELGIHGPFKKSHRRERRPFTEQDDIEILEGLDTHGPSWTKIQRDPRFHLSSRQPTDLRDRVRNKYAEVYQRIEKGTFQPKETGRGNDVAEQSASTLSSQNSFQPSKAATLEPQMKQPPSHEDLPRWTVQQRIDTGEAIGTAQVFEFGEAATPQFMGGEMDISRLLLDDAKLSPLNSRFGFEGIPGLSPPASASQKGHNMDSKNPLRR